MTLATVRQRLMDQGAGGILDTAHADRVIGDAYQQILRNRPWVVALKTTQLWVNAPYTTGTVTATNGSAIIAGSGTTFTAAMVGRYLSVGDTVPQRIITFTGPTSITIDTAWSGATVSNQNYAIVHMRLALPTDAERVERLSGPTWNLVRRSLAFINEYDPRRRVRADPLVFAETERRGSPTAYAAPEIELWPVPSQEKMYRAVYRAAIPSPTADGDSFILNEDMVLHNALAHALMLLYTRTRQSALLEAAKAHDGIYREILQSETRQDQRMRGPMPAVLDSDDSLNPVYPENLSAWRVWQAQSSGS
jgi:hypothetical protein